MIASWASAPLAALWPVTWTEPLRALLALSVLFLLIRPRGHRLARFVERARARFALKPTEPWPWPRLRAGHLLLSSGVGFAAGWTLAPTVIATLCATLIDAAATEYWGRRLLRHTKAPRDTTQAARRYLRMIGLPASEGDGSLRLTTRREGEPGRGAQWTEGSAPLSRGLWSGGETMRLGLRIAAILGIDVTLSVHREGKGWCELTLLARAEPSPSALLHEELLDAVWRGLRTQRRIDDWPEHRLCSARYEEAVLTPCPLTVDLLRYRGTPEGAAGDAKRRFGLRELTRPLVVRLGSNVYDLIPKAPQPLRPGLVQRLAARAVANGAIAGLPHPPTLSALWRGEVGRQSEEAGLAAAVAKAEVWRRAEQAQVSPLPPLAPEDPVKPTFPPVPTESPYALTPRTSTPLPSFDPLPRAAELAYGPGPKALKHWRGVLRAAEVRREAARLVVCELSGRVAQMLEATHGAQVFQGRLHAISELPSGIESAEGISPFDLPPSLDIPTLESLGVSPIEKSPQALKGHAVGFALPFKGRVTTHQPPGPGEISVVERVSPQALQALVPGAAIVAERGSPLSHAAIVAREQAFPLVLGVRGALNRLKPGETLTLSPTGELFTADAQDDL